MGQNHATQLSNGYGYRIINVEPQSCGSFLNLEIFLDYIIQIKSGNTTNQVALLESDEPLELTIFNIYSQTTRKVYISEPRSTSRLGLQIRLESYVDPLILHVTYVLPNSPAHLSGLCGGTDYLLGLISHRYESLNEFSDIVTGMAYQKQTIDVCIFTPSKHVAPHIIQISPNYNWGGQGALGCEFASGALHSFTSSLVPMPLTGQKQPITPSRELPEQQNGDMLVGTGPAQDHSKGEILLEVQPVLEEQSEHRQQEAQSFLQASPLQVPEEETQLNQQQTDKENSRQNDSTVQQPGSSDQTVKFKGILRFAGNEQSNIEELGEDKLLEGKLSVIETQQRSKDLELSLNNSFQSKNASSDYSHIQQSAEQVQQQLQLTQTQTQPQPPPQSKNEEAETKVQSNLKYINKLVFNTKKRESLYLVDKRLLFDIDFEFPKFFVNIY